MSFAPLSPDKLDPGWKKSRAKSKRPTQSRRNRIRIYRDRALIAQKNKCFYCLSRLTRKKATADHVQPRSENGSHDEDNIVAACDDCNTAKADMSLNQFKKIIRNRRPPAPRYLMIWATYRINKRAHTACRRIMKSIGSDYD